MKIAQSQLQMGSTRLAETYHEVRDSVATWKGGRRLGQENESATSRKDPLGLPPASRVAISDAAKNAASLTQANVNTAKGTSKAKGSGMINEDPKTYLIRMMVEMLTGKKIKAVEVNGGSNCSPAQPSSDAPVQDVQDDWDVMAVSHSEIYSEYESVTFDASGTVLTADGREISFSISVAMERSFYSESSSTVWLNKAAQTQDPLVINFNGPAAQLTNTRFAFDLEGDGTAENIHFATGGSGFLAFDKNSDGVINDGNELFGPATGNGFKELAALDTDRNGWIDENDADWDKLRIWSKDESGNDRLLTLREAGVGAISVDNLSTLFSLMNSSNQLKGQIQSTGIFLREDGMPGTIQHVDLSV